MTAALTAQAAAWGTAKSFVCALCELESQAVGSTHRVPDVGLSLCICVACTEQLHRSSVARRAFAASLPDIAWNVLVGRMSDSAGVNFIALATAISSAAKAGGTPDDILHAAGEALHMPRGAIDKAFAQAVQASYDQAAQMAKATS